MAKKKDDKKDKDKDKKAAGGGGFLGRFFGGKKDEGGAPTTPGAEGMAPEDAPTIPPGSVPATPGGGMTGTPGGDFSPDGVTIESNAPIADDGMATIPPGYVKAAKPGKPEKGKKGAPATPPRTPPRAGGDLDVTMPPAYAAGAADDSPRDEVGELTMVPNYAQPRPTPPAAPGDDMDFTMPPSYAAPGASPRDEVGELTMVPSYAQRTPGAPPGELDGTLPPGYFGGASPDRTIPPTYADPFQRGGDEDQDLLVTNDPDLAPAPRVPAQDPFAFGDDVLAPAPAAPPPRGAAPAPAAPAQDQFGFGDDVLDLLAPSPGAPSAAASAAPDPFGAPLADDPFEVGAPPPPATAGAPPVRPLGHKTEELEPPAIEVFDVDLDGGPPSHAPSTPASPEPVSQEERTLEMDRPEALPAGRPREMQYRTTKVDRPLPDLAAEDTRADRGSATSPEAPAVSAPVARALFASSVSLADGGRRLGPKAAEVTLDEKSGTLHAPAVPGGWANVPAFAVVLGDGSVVGRLPRGARYEADGSLLLPAPAKRRGHEPEPSGPGRRASAFPAGVAVDRAARVAHAPAELAAELEGSPEPKVRLDDGGLVLFIPEGARWNDDGSYTLPPEPPKPLAAPGRAAAEAGAPVAPAHPAHGVAVWKASYLGCEEVVYEDGWGSLRLPAGSKIDADHVLLPPASRAAAGTPPDLLEVETRGDGWIALPIPEGFLPEGELVWLAPAPIEEPEPEPWDAVACEEWGEPTDRLVYAGIEDALHANGWTRLELPPGARVKGQRVRLPREYAHAADARSLAAFDRDPDGALTFELPAEAEVLGSVVLLPPAGEAPAPRPVSAGSSSASSASGPSSGSAAFRSAAPPEGGESALNPRKTQSLDRFRAKKAGDAAAPSSGEITRDRKDSADEPKKADDAPTADPPASSLDAAAKSDDAKSDDAKSDDAKTDDAKSDGPSDESAAADDAKAADEAKSDDGAIRPRGKKRKKN